MIKKLVKEWNHGMKNGNKGKPKSKEHRENISKALIGRRRPKEVRERISRTRRKRLKMGLIKPWNKGLSGQEYLSHFKHGKVWNKGLTRKTDKRLALFDLEPARKRLRELKLDPKWRSKWLESFMKAKEISPNKVEKKLIMICQDNSLPLQFVGDGSMVIGGKNPDFIDSEGKNKVVEVFGDYWHNPNKNKKLVWHQTEKGTKKVYRQYGYDCLIIWESELNTLLEGEIVNKIGTFLNG